MLIRGTFIHVNGIDTLHQSRLLEWKRKNQTFFSSLKIDVYLGFITMNGNEERKKHILSDAIKMRCKSHYRINDDYFFFSG